MKNKKVLIIEDDQKISDLVKLYLEKENFQVIVALDGKEGLELAGKESPDFIVLDLMLPEISGMHIARQIRRKSNVPILMLTAKAEEFDKVLGLEIGADDYLTKPFSPKELVARVKAILRRVEANLEIQTSGKIKIKDLEIDPQKHQIRKQKKIVNLTRLEFKLLLTLASHPGQVFSRDRLINQIYNQNDEVIFDRTIDVHIKNLRRKLKDNSRTPQYIKSVHGVGYKFKEEV